MNYLQAVALGFVQGIAEFFPVSSSGHLVLLKELFGIGEIPVLFDVILHIATLLAVLMVFRRRIGSVLRSLFRFIGRKHDGGDRENLSLFGSILVATVVTAVIGFGIEKYVPPAGAKTVAVRMLVTSAILVSTLFIRARSGGYGDMTPGRSLFVGLAQGLGVFSGISRSGITISAGLAAGLAREKAGEYSFLLSIPAVLGAFILTVKDLAEVGASVEPGPLAVAFLVAFLSGFVALTTLVSVVKRGKLAWFAVYLVPVAVTALLFL